MDGCPLVQENFVRAQKVSDLGLHREGGELVILSVNVPQGKGLGDASIIFGRCCSVVGCCSGPCDSGLEVAPGPERVGSLL